MATVREIADYLEERVPSSLKLDFDNVGLLCGFPDREVSRMLVVLDVTQQAIEEALSLHAELIVSHHPLIFTPLRRICTDTPDAKRVIALLQGNLSAICLHTNLDALEGGVNTALANAVGGEELAASAVCRRLCLLRIFSSRPVQRFPLPICAITTLRGVWSIWRSAAARAGTFCMKRHSAAAIRY